MARIVPDDLAAIWLSGAHSPEIDTLALLRDKLPVGYTVFHSVHWTAETRPVINGVKLPSAGEADFLVVNKAGDALLVEQKNGVLEETAAGIQKSYTERADHIPTKLRHCLYGLRSKFQRLNAGHLLRVDYLFYCPDHRVKDLNAAALDPSRIVDSEIRSELHTRIMSLLPLGEDNRQHRERVESFLAQTFNLVPDIHSRIATQDKCFVQLTGGLLEFVENFEMNPLRLRVKGTAGCGKSLIALKAFEHALARGRKPLLVCFNRPLAEKFKVSAPRGGYVNTWYGLCAEFLQSRGEKLDFEDLRRLPDFWRKIEERVIAATVPAQWRFDSIIVDEGQDFESEVFEILRTFCAEPADILWLEDADQKIRNGTPVALPGFVGLRVRQNYRTPISIARVIQEVLPFDFEAVSPVMGLGCSVSTYNDPDEQPRIVGHVVSTLIKAGFRHGDIVVLSMRGLERAKLTKENRVGNFTLARFTGEYDLLGNQLRTKGQIAFDTVHRFKGQQAAAVVVTDLDPSAENADRNARLLFTAMTRSTLRLELVLNRTNPLNQPLLDAASRG